MLFFIPNFNDQGLAMRIPRLFLSILLMISLSSCGALKGLLSGSIKEPTVNYQSVAFDKLSLDEVKLTPTFTVKNDNAFAIPLQKINYALSLNNTKLLDGAIDKVGTLPANGSTQLPLPLTLDKQTMATFKNLLQNNKQIDYNVQGNVEVMGLKVPFEKANTFFRPEFKISKFNIVDASMKQLKVMLSLNIHNKNDFKIPLSGISYNIASKGKALFSGQVADTTITKGETVIDIPIAIDPSKLVSSIFSLMSNPELPLDVNIKTPIKDIKFSEKVNLQQLLSK